MRIAKVIGNVTLNRNHPSLDGSTLKLALPMLLNKSDQLEVSCDELIAMWDELGCGNGAIIAVSEGPEAARPFRPNVKPIDACSAALLDTISIELHSVEMTNPGAKEAI